MILLTFKINSLKQLNTKIIILNLLLFVVGLSIPFAYAFNSISIGLLFLYSFIWFKKSNYLLLFQKGSQVHVLFLIYFIIQLIGAFYSDNLNIGFAYVTQNIVFLILPITFINLSEVLNYGKIKIVIYGLITGVLVILLSIHINIFFKIFYENLDYKSLLFYFVRVNFVQLGLVEIHPPYFGLIVVFCLVVVFNIKFSKNILLNILVKYSISTYFLISLYGISSFMSFILLVLLFIIYIFFLIKKKKIQSLILILVSVLLTIIIIGSQNNTKLIYEFPGQSLLGRIEWSFVKGKGDTSRPENWRSVLLVVKDNLLIGIGSDGGLDYLQAHRSKTSESYRNKHNSHNQYLETLLRHGIIGLFIYLLIIGVLVLNAIKSRDIIFCCFIFIFIIASITESYLVRQIGLTFFTIYALLFNTFYNFNNNKQGI